MLIQGLLPEMIPYGRQAISETDIETVADVLRSDYLTQGPVVPRFESLVANYCGVAHAVAMNSATSALHLACLALGLGPGDYLWTSPISFVASANCGLYCGAAIDFVDIDPQTYNLSTEALEEKLSTANKLGRLPKVVVAVHMCGQSCDMAYIHALSIRYGFRVIEDASHAIGGRYLDGPIGNCQYSDVTVFSFHPVKIITTAEGGMALTNDSALARRMTLLRSHGITRDQAEMEGESHGPWYYQQIALGYNYRMTELQAALGCSQMDRIDQFVARRRGLAQRYDHALDGLPLVCPWQHPDGMSSYHLYVIRLLTGKVGINHRNVFEKLRELGIGVNLHYIPIHTQPYYARLGFRPEEFPNAMAYYSQAISLPLYPAMTESQQDQVICAATEVLQ